MLILLFIIVLLWFLIPLLPSLRALRQPRHAEPLKIASRYNTELQHAAAHFGAMMKPVVSRLREIQGDAGLMRRTAPAVRLIVSETDTVQALQEDDDRALLLHAAQPVKLPEGLNFERPLYTTGTIATSENTRFDMVFGESDVHLSPGTMVYQSVHARGTLVAAPHCILLGSTSADGALYVYSGVQFEHLRAPVILFLSSVHPAITQPPLNLAAEHLRTYEPAAGVGNATNRRLYVGDLEIPPKHVLEGDLIVTGHVSVGEGSRIVGNVKARKGVILESSVSIYGSLFSNRDLRIGRGNYIQGVVSAEGELVIAEDVQIGSLSRRATVSADRMLVSPSVRIYGTVWALNEGRIRSSEQPSYSRAA